MNAAQSVIGAITLGGKDAYWRVADLIKPDDFADRWSADVFRIMGEIARSSAELDVITICSEMERQGIADQHEVIDCAGHTPGWSAVRTYAELVRSDATQRRVRAICAEGAKTGDVATVQAALSSLLNAQPAHAVLAADALNRMWKGVMARYEAGDTFSGLLTGIPLLDEWTGGLQPGRVYGIGARAKMGKTVLAMGICAHAALAGKSVGVWSLEMSDEELMQRMACAAAGVRSVLLQRPKLLDEDDTAMSKLHAAIKALKAAPLRISDRTDVTIEEIEAQARQMHACGQLDLLCIDYLGLLRMPKMDRHDLAIAHVTRRIKIIAKELRIPVLLVFQLNRGSEHGQAVRPPRPSDARDSGAIEQDLDAMLLLHRPSYYDKRAKPGLRLDLALQRNGPTGLIHMNDDLACCRFTGGGQEWTDEVASKGGRDDEL
jgi:replicative DNA helicase